MRKIILMDIMRASITSNYKKLMSIMEEAVENLTEELEETSPQSLLIDLRKDGLLPLWFPCVCHTAELAVKDFLKTDLGNRGEINAIVKKAQEFVNLPKVPQSVQRSSWKKVSI